MLNKFTVSMLLLLVLAGLILVTGFVNYFTMALAVIIPLLAILAWFNNVSNRRKEKFVKVSKEENIQDDGEYHNDFSKVPAGIADTFQPPPRSIGYGYGDGGKSVMEDLERIGIREAGAPSADQTCCSNQVFERHQDSTIADIGSSDGIEFTIGRCTNCGSLLIFCWVAGGVSQGNEVVSQELVDTLLSASDRKERKKLLSNWFNGLS